MKSLFLLDTQTSPRGIGNMTYYLKAGEGLTEEGVRG
jgi:hypothetical protein